MKKGKDKSKLKFDDGVNVQNRYSNKVIHTYLLHMSMVDRDKISNDGSRIVI